MKVKELTPGDKIELAGTTAVFVAKCPHPYYTGFQLVTWWTDKEEWSHDALLADQEVGNLVSEPQFNAEIRAKRARLQQIFAST
jgi:hypothetical protein